MTKSKGFTIIELIVVIAIIAILAAIVLVNVTQYINKAKDASIKANVDTIMTNSAVFFADETKGNGSYNDGTADFSTYPEYTIAADQIDAQNGSAANRPAPVTTMDGTKTLFCVSAVLQDGTIYCKDSSGVLGTTACSGGVCGSGALTCTPACVSPLVCNTSTGVCE